MSIVKIKYDTSLVKLFPYFESVTRVQVRDCVDQGERLIFFVDAHELGKAVGKHAVNVKHLEFKLKKKIKVIGYSEDKITLLKNIVFPLTIADVQEDGDTLILTSPDHQTRGMLIGRGGQNLRSLEQLMQRFFPVKEIKVL